MSVTERWMEGISWRLARQGSRHSFLAGIDLILIGVGIAPLSPVSRFMAAHEEEGDLTRCDYWCYCVIDGFLCTCCSSTTNSCRPGTVTSLITRVWICLNPADGKDYIISYNDCFGLSGCSRCGCARDEGDRPAHRTDAANDINWCARSADDIVYNCSTAVLMGVSTDGQ